MFEVSTTVPEIDNAFFYIFAVSVFFLLAVTFTMLWFLVRYNHKRHPVAADIEGNMALEITWTVIPTLLALGMFYFGWLGFDVIRKVPRGAIPIEVTGRMFFWTFKYEGGRQTSELYVPVGKPIRLNLKSADVIHSFYVPAFKIKKDCVPGADNYLSFTPLRAGVYDVSCAEFCGTGHSTMLTRLVAMPPKDFELWLKKPTEQKPLQMTDAMAGTPEQIERGKLLYALTCASCHSPDGTGKGTADARNFTSLENWKNGSTVAKMFRTLDNGLGKKMPSFKHLPVDARFALIHYVRKFAQGHPQNTPAEIAALDKEFEISAGRMPPPELAIQDAMEIIAAETAQREASTPPVVEDSPKP